MGDGTACARDVAGLRPAARGGAIIDASHHQRCAPCADGGAWRDWLMAVAAMALCAVA